MIALQKLLRLKVLLFLTICAAIYTSWLLGYEGFLLTGSIYMPVWATYVVSTLLFMINFIMWAGIIWNEYSRNLLKYSLPYLAIYIKTEILFQPSLLTSFMLPMAYILIISVFMSSFKESIIRCLKFLGLMVPFQFIALVVRTGLFIGNPPTAIYQAFIMSIDLLLFTGILFCKGGARYYVRPSVDLESSVFPEAIEIAQQDSEDRAAIGSFAVLSKWRKASAIFLFIAFQVFQWTIALAICLIGNVFWEGFALSASFVAFGFIVKRRWHSNSIVLCTLASAAMFYVGARLLPSLYFSWLLPVLLGLTLIYALYRISIHTDRMSNMQEELERLTSFKLEPFCDYEKMKAIALERGLSKRQIEMLEYKYCKKANWAQLEIKFAPWSQSSIRKYIKEAETKFSS